MMKFLRFAAALLGCLLAAHGSAMAQEPIGFEIISERELSGSLLWANDIRWNSSGKGIFLAAGRKGVFELSLAPSSEPAVAIPGEGSSGGFFFSALVAASGDHLVAGSRFNALTWKSWTSGKLMPPFPFSTIVDLDLSADKLVILGARRDSEDRWAPEGAIVWTGSLSKKLSDVRPLYFSRSGSGASDMARCHFLDLGGVKFFPDGSLVVVPGVEPGVYLYDRNLKLTQTWQTDKLGTLDRCELSDAEWRPLAARPEPRFRYLSTKQVVDEILPLPEGPGLIIRSQRAARTEWSLAILGRDGSVRRMKLPFDSSWHLSHVKAAMRGVEIAFLVHHYGRLEDPEKTPKPRLIIAKISGTKAKQ